MCHSFTYLELDSDFLDLLSTSEYSHQSVVPEGEGFEEGASELPNNNVKIFQKEMLKLMIEGIKISLVSDLILNVEMVI